MSATDADRIVMLIGFGLAATPEEQADLAAKILGWPIARVNAAFAEAREAGHIDTPPEEEETVEDAFAALVESGDMEIVGHDAEGEPQYSLTAQGKASAEALVVEAKGRVKP